MKITEMSLAALSAALDRREVSAVEATRACLERIKSTAELNNFITVFDDEAVRAAETADGLRAKGESVGPLCGVPVALKDNIKTRGIRTTCASRAMAEYIPYEDADVVKKLRSAHAVIIGKNNMDELAMGSTNSSSAFGTVKNVLDLTRVAGGSSGGSANCVAAKQAFGALGSDTGGSVRQPAAYCGVVGLKPTPTAVCKNGLIGLAPSLDGIGVLARDCDDAFMLYNAVAEESAIKCVPLIGNVKGLRVGIADEFTATDGLDGDVGVAFEKTVELLQRLGAEVVRVSIPSFGAALAAYHVVSSAEAASVIDKLYDGEELKLLGAEVRRRIMTGSYVTSDAHYDDMYIKAAKVRAVVKSEYTAALKTCDVLISPTAPNVATKLDEKIPPHIAHFNDMYAAPVSLAALPAVSVPSYTAHGMPVGIQIIGRAFCERDILNVGKAVILNR